MRELTISEREEGQRLDKFLMKYMELASPSFFYKMLRKKNIVLNGKKAGGNEKLRDGDRIKLFLSEETIDKFQKHAPMTSETDHDFPIEQYLIYEDERMLLFHKPVGMLSQKASSDDFSAIDRIISYLVNSGKLTGSDLKVFRPGLCNRLDRNTSGILVCGKTIPALQELNRMFRERTIAKYYTCITCGEIREPVHLKGYLSKDERDNLVSISDVPAEDRVPIETVYEPLSSNGAYTYLKVHLITGKSHQIRAHLAWTGHPILGDPKYGSDAENRKFRKDFGLRSQLLHGGELIFPETDGIFSDFSGTSFHAQEPQLFQKITETLNLKQSII